MLNKKDIAASVKDLKYQQILPRLFRTSGLGCSYYIRLSDNIRSSDNKYSVVKSRYHAGDSDPVICITFEEATSWCQEDYATEVLKHHVFKD